MIRKTRQTGAPTIQYKNSVNKNNKNQDTPTEGRRAREGRSLAGACWPQCIAIAQDCPYEPFMRACRRWPR